MSNLLKLTGDQQKVYDRYIKARNKMGIGRGLISKTPKPKWIPSSDYIACIDVTGLNHPMFIANDAYLEYQEAFQAWLAIEPEFRFAERMRASRGDYGLTDSWEEKQ